MENNQGFSLLEKKSIYFLIITVSMYFFALDLYAPSLPQIKTLFQAPFHKVQLTITVFAIGFCTCQLLFGALISHYDKRKILLATSAVFSLTSLAIVSTHSIDTLYLYRFIQGACCAAMYVIGFATARELVAENRLSTIMPLSSLGFTLMSALSPIVGGLIIQFGQWHQVFSSMAFIGFILLVSTYFLFPKTVKQTVNQVNEEPAKTSLVALNSFIRASYTNYKTMLSNSVFTISSFISISAVVAMVIFYQIASFLFIEEAQVSSLNFGIICFLLILVSVLARLYYLRYLRETNVIQGLLKWSLLSILAALISYLSSLTQGINFILLFSLSYSGFIFALSVVHCYALVYAFMKVDKSKTGYSAAIYGTLTSSYIVIGSVIASEYEPSVNYLIVLMIAMACICLTGTTYIYYKTNMKKPRTALN
ncbi:bicyclomycin resistance protein [Marinomonas sp. MED121]|uniref:MFS transporter n=1 Tax=Marinomonas sp. MED121 TaxID=314277 RepID=UPI0000690FF5|nr:MFS transporter [Marinomonas sp. MED121]EAQ67745.1 bicyclomycin resistance protein [Marinomonas sp. MED121]